MGLNIDSIQSFIKAKRILAARRDDLRIATLGYPYIRLKKADAESLFGESVQHMDIRSDLSSGKFGLQVVSYALAGSKAPDNEVLMFETFSLFAALGCHCQAFDLIPLHGIETITDLGRPIDKRLCDCFDFIMDGGTAEHCFNISQVLYNIVGLLKKDGFAYHLSPWASWGHGFYNFEPKLFFDFYEANGFKVIECYTYMNGLKKEITRANWASFQRTSYPYFHFLAQKIAPPPEVQDPIDSQYAQLFKMSQLYTYGPLLNSECLSTGKKEDPAVRLTKTGSLYDSIIRNMRTLCDENEFNGVVSNKDLIGNPYKLQELYHDLLLRRTDELIQKAASKMSGEKAYYWVANLDTYERWRKDFANVQNVAFLSEDIFVDTLVQNKKLGG